MLAWHSGWFVTLLLTVSAGGSSQEEGCDRELHSESQVRVRPGSRYE